MSQAQTEAMRAPWRFESFHPTITQLCISAGYLIVLVAVPVWVFMLGLTNPPSPSMPANELLARIQDIQIPMLLGCSILMFIWTLFCFWMAPITMYIRRMERSPILTLAQLICCGGCLAAIYLTPLFIALAAFRAEDALVVQTFWDISMFFFIYTFPPFGFSQIIIGVAVLTDVNEKPLFQRWFGYFNVFCGIGTTPCYVLPFFMDGPFAYNGLIVWWFVLIVYFAWFLVATIVFHQKIRRDIAAQRAGEQEEAITSSASPVPAAG